MANIDLSDKIRIAGIALENIKEVMAHCCLCPRECGIDRLKGERGDCDCRAMPVVYAETSHMGEEPPISGSRGSGTIFFSGCSMHCIYCQNYLFSQRINGKEVSASELSEIMMGLERDGCHNVNLVSPTCSLNGIIEALMLAFSKGMKLPIVYNSGGYDSLSVIKMLEGVVDIYLPDMKYSVDAMAEKYSRVSGYVNINRRIVKEMYRQAGPLIIKEGLAIKGVIIRVLVMPNAVSGALDSLEFIAGELGTNIGLSIMSQYHPFYKASAFPEMNRKLLSYEYEIVVEKARELGFDLAWIQPFNSNFSEDLFGENFKPNI